MPKSQLKIEIGPLMESLWLQNMKSAMKENKVKGFANTLLCSNLADSIDILIQSTGIGGLRPNTVMVGWPAGWKDSAADMQNPYWTFIGLSDC